MRKVRLVEVADLTVGFVGTMAKHYVDKGVPFIRSMNVEPFRLNYNDLKYITPEFNDKLSKSKLHKGDVVIVRTGKPGACAVISDEYDEINCSDLVIVRPHTEELDSLYAACYINNSYRTVNAHLVGAVQQHFNVKVAGNLVIDLPPLLEQKRIAEIIGNLNDKILINESVNENFLEQMEALYMAWFTDFVPFDGNRPSDWELSDIYSIANIIYGAPFSSKLFNTDGEGVPIIRIRDLKEQAFVTYTTENHPKGHLIQPGDIVVGMDGEFRPYIWGNTEAWLNQRVCIFENKRPKGKAFVLFTIKPLLSRIEQTQVATTVIHIGKKDYDAFEFYLPDNHTLDQFDEITSPMIDQIVVNSLENKRLAELRNSLLPKLMSGELDVSGI